jgi:hypothetical protein
VFPPAIIRAIAPPLVGGLNSALGNLFFPLAQGAMALVVPAAIEEGTDITAGEAYARLGKRSGSMVGVSIIIGIFIGVGLILLVIPGIIAIAWTAVAGPAVAIERITGGAALSRSRALTRGRTGHVLGTLLLAWIIGAALYVLAFLAAMARLGVKVVQLVTQLVWIAVLPLLTVPATFLYSDLRVRNEGADIDAMVAGLPAEPLAT